MPSPGRAGTLSCLANGAVAEAFQTAADRSFDGELCGHRIGAPSIEVQQLLNIQEPILRQDVLPSGATFRMSARLLSVECEFGDGAMIFLVPRRFGDDRLTDIGECFVLLELVGE